MERVKQSSTFDWLIYSYFSDPASRLQLKKGDCLIEQGGHNERLYLVLRGALQGYMVYEDGSRVETLRAGVNSFIGVYSFFSGTYHSIATVEALEPSEVAYITRHQLVIPSVQGNSLKEQFMPVVVADLMQRQQRMQEIAKEKELAYQQLMEQQRMASLGQLAAGIAHELNNAVSVLARNTNWLAEEYGANWLDAKDYPFFESGLLYGRIYSSRDIRQKKQRLMEKFALEEELAEALAQTGVEEAVLGKMKDTLTKRAGQMAAAWELGATFHDMRVAAEQSTHVVKSIKALGAQNQQMQDGVEVNDTIRDALSLLSHKLKYVEVKLEQGDLPAIRANRGEMVQVWLNLIRNACEAVAEKQEKSPRLQITTDYSAMGIRVRVSDNGPGIPPEIQPRIFQPNTTTKVNGLSFGLGLGLSIVQKILSRHQGTIRFETSEQGTTFIVGIPAGGEHDKN